jgi:hypothetical protein
MNRHPFPQYPQQYSQPLMPGPGPGHGPGPLPGSGGPGTPGSIRASLIGQSQRRYAFMRDALSKLEAGFSALEVEATNVIARAAQQNPTARNQLEISLAASRARQERVRRGLDEVMQADVALQDELARWINGQPPSDYAPSGVSQRQQTPQYQHPVGYEARQQAPQYEHAQQQRQQQQQQQPLPPPGQVDMRDPVQAAGALLRAQPMPLGPQPVLNQPQYPVGYQQVPQYAQPQYAQPQVPVPPAAAMYNGQPLPQSPVPVQMQYADPSQAGPANMPMAPPVTQYASPEAAQAVVTASHAAGVPAATVTATAAGPVSPVANGTASKPATT